LMAPLHENGNHDTYFVRQPTTPVETEQAINAVRVCCVAAVRYGGRVAQIISALGNDPETCDYIVGEDGQLTCTVGDDGSLLPFAQRIVAARREAYLRQLKKPEKQWWQFWR
jgi:hypothetical protein